MATEIGVHIAWAVVAHLDQEEELRKADEEARREW